MIVEQSKPTHGRFQDLTDQPFNRWTVQAYGGRHPVGQQLKTFWICKCICGNIRAVTAQQLKSKMSGSCGCLAKERVGESHRTHGASNTIEYKIWKGIRQRCFSVKSPDWHNYGGRGITMCHRWNNRLNGFPNFLNDMGPRPSRSHSVERKDNDGPYSPENCIWATNAEQSRNRRTSRLITWQDETLCIKDWADKFNMRYDKLRRRLLRYRWPFEKAVGLSVA